MSIVLSRFESDRDCATSRGDFLGSGGSKIILSALSTYTREFELRFALLWRVVDNIQNVVKTSRIKVRINKLDFKLGTEQCFEGPLAVETGIVEGVGIVW